ncbi:MAG: S8 family serine peptidase [Chloracidobacterium sp.]|nr:S8 family serine peptidase [Chloracidobacterium sp.]
MKHNTFDLRGSTLLGFRAIFVGSLLLLLTITALFETKTRTVKANASLVNETSVDSLFVNVLKNKPGSKIAPAVVDDLFDSKTASVVIFLADQADLSAAYGIKDQDERGWYVYNTLRTHAEQTQGDLKSFLTARGVEFKSYWIANMLIAEVDRTTADQLSLRSDVKRIDSNRQARWIEDPAIADFQESSERPDAPQTVEPGLTNVNAPAVWALGFTGQNMVIGNQDTGMRWTHTAIKPKYRGWNGTTADHNFNWYDSIHSQIPGSPAVNPCGRNALAPCDDNGHGTHTTGTTVGDDGSTNQVGVAPGAKWIGCRNMDSGNGTPATYSECFQFFIAPTDLTGNNANPSLRPHVMNNSWGCPASEGCTTGAELETIVNNTQAAGIFVVVSAGNAGPSCSTVEDAPAIYNAAFSVGSISPTSNNLSSFSSRGPSLFYTPNLLKPNISAPGSGIRSSTFSSDTSYGNLSGTSMAGPHVAGVVALLWSARPALERNIEATKTLLQNTANPNVNITTGTQTCGGTPSTQIPNNSFGYGRIDALAAFNAAGGSTPTATATNTPTNTSTPTNTPTAAATATNTPTPAAATISGTVTYGNAIGAPATRLVSNVLLSGAGSTPISATTDALGTYSLSGFGAGSYTITPSKSGGQNGSITSFDAARIAQYVVGANTLNATQLIVGDVSNSGSVSSFDSAMVASFAVSAPNVGSSGTWKFIPVNVTHPSVTSSITGEDYAALLMGDVTGNWVNAGFRPTYTNGPERPILVAAPKILSQTGDANIPISVSGLTGKNIISYEFDLRYDPAVMTPQSNPVGLDATASRGFSIAYNTIEPGLLRVAVYGTTPMTEAGTLLNLRFWIVGTLGANSPLTWERIVFNEGAPSVEAANGLVTITPLTMISE